MASLATVAILIIGMAGQPSVPAALRDLRSLEIRVGDRPMRVVVAADHASGLMGIADLGSIDGMLFEYPSEVRATDHRFWMQGVLIPLDIAFFAADGRLVSQVVMPLCPDADQATRGCPLYAAEGPFRWALETKAGSFGFDPGVSLAFPG